VAALLNDIRSGKAQVGVAAISITAARQTEFEFATERDTLVLLDVMIDDIDVGWWRELRERVEAEFKQDEVVIRSVAMQRI
jgi:hypothetical protein